MSERNEKVSHKERDMSRQMLIKQFFTSIGDAYAAMDSLEPKKRLRQKKKGF
jgi:hypothetical protein